MTIYLVGDVDQLLYRFAGAKPELLTSDIDQYVPDIQTKFLDVNYRSTNSIIEASKKLIAKNYSDEGGPYEQKFMKATQPRPDAEEGEPIHFKMLPTVRDEAKYVADTILEQLENGYEPGDFFVGARTRAQLGYYEGPLFRAGIKFVNIAGGSFWQNYHVANIIGFLRLAHDTTDDEAFQQVFNIASVNHTDKNGDYCHHHWMGAEFLKLTKGSYSLMHLAINHNRRYYYGVEDLKNFIHEIQGEIAYANSPAEVINCIVENCYKQWLKAKGEMIEEDADSNILDDIATIMDVASEHSSVESFLNYVKEMIQAAEEAKQGNLDEYVVLSTYHRLKGSERKIMIGTGWCEGVSSLNGEPRGLLPHTFSLTSPPQFGVLLTSGMSMVEDERCIGFVAVTRAKERVFLTGCSQYRDWVLQPSRFVYELGVELQQDRSDKFTWSEDDIQILEKTPKVEEDFEPQPTDIDF